MKEKKKSKKFSAFPILVWILAMIVILIGFMVKMDDIKTNLKESGFFDKIFGKTPAFISEHKVEEKEDFGTETDSVITINKLKEKVSGKEDKTSKLLKKDEKTGKVEKTEVSIKQPEPVPEKKVVAAENVKEPVAVPEVEKIETSIFKETEKPLNSKTESVEKTSDSEPLSLQSSTIEKNTEKKDSVPSEKPEPIQKKAEKPVELPQKPVETPKPVTLKSKIWFVSVMSDGSVVRKEAVRTVEKDSPLLGSIKSLLAGPNTSEESINYMSLIPENTRLLGATVKNGVATLNFSEEFAFNPFGVEGYLAQLMQIVYTATEFSTVKSVQILIEGSKKDYLGSEGVWIGSPLTRASFR